MRDRSRPPYQRWANTRATKRYQEGRSRSSSLSLRRPPIHFSAFRNGHVTQRRHLAETVPPTHLAQSACLLTSISHQGSATACSVMQPQHHCCGMEQAQRGRCQTKRGPANLTIRVVVRGHSNTDTSGASGFQLLCTLADDVDGGCCVQPQERSDVGGSCAEGHKTCRQQTTPCLHN